MTLINSSFISCLCKTETYLESVQFWFILIFLKEFDCDLNFKNTNNLGYILIGIIIIKFEIK